MTDKVTEEKIEMGSAEGGEKQYIEWRETG
jgi:hypothetical protein